MMQTNKTKLTALIILIIFIGLFIFINYAHNHLAQKGILLNAKTIKWIGGAKMSINLQYEFYYNNKHIISSCSTSPFLTGKVIFTNKNFPLIYDPKFDLGDLLITPNDFKKYNIPFPDSLNWVLEYIK